MKMRRIHVVPLSRQALVVLDSVKRQTGSGNSISQAYNHAEYLDKRTEMMQWWADYLDGLKDGTGKENS